MKRDSVFHKNFTVTNAGSLLPTDSHFKNPDDSILEHKGNEHYSAVKMAWRWEGKILIAIQSTNDFKCFTVFSVSLLGQ